MFYALFSMNCSSIPKLSSTLFDIYGLKHPVFYWDDKLLLMLQWMSELIELFIVLKLFEWVIERMSCSSDSVPSASELFKWFDVWERRLNEWFEWIANQFSLFCLANLLTNLCYSADSKNWFIQEFWLASCSFQPVYISQWSYSLIYLL